MISLSLESLQKSLKENGYEANIQKETDQIYILLKIDETEFPLFIKIFHEGDLLQMLTFIPCAVQEEYLPDLGRLLHLFNKELDLPGFGLDESTKMAFYRVVIPTIKKKIPFNILDKYLAATQVVCKNFAPAISAIANGKANLDEILKQNKEE